MRSIAQCCLIAILLSNTISARQSKMITVVVPEGNAQDAILEVVLHIFANEFAVRFKQVSKDVSCVTYSKLSRQYAPSSGQTLVIFSSKDRPRPFCEGRRKGSVFVVRPYKDDKTIPTFKYGEMQQSEATDKTANIYRFINILHKRTTVSSDRGTLARVPVRPLEAKRQDGVPIPGYVVLLIALLLVVALAILASAIMNYHKRSAAQKGVFGESPVMRTKRAKKSQRKGHHEERPRSPLEKPEGSQGNEEINKMRSEPFGDICKAVSKETWEELALVISKRRKMEDVLNDPVTSPEFLFYLHRLSRMAIEYYDDPAVFNVTTDSSQGFLYRTMPRFAPETPEPFTVICNDLKKKILPGMTHWQHPRFYAYYPAGRPYPDVLAELLTSAMAFNIFSWESCPSLNELENTVVNWIGRAFGLPESFLFQETPQTSSGGGSIVGSASDAIFCSVLVSRNWKINQVKDYQKSSGEAKFETAHDVGKKLVVYCSKDAHSCIEKACKVAMVRCRPIQPLAANKWGITGGQLEKCILKDIESGLIPTHIHVTLGTSATAADDHLESIWPVAKKYHMWIHCDASYSGNAWLDKKYRDNATAIEHVHSINVNLHKFLLFSGMTCLVWTRERNIYKEAFTTVSLQRRLMQGLYTTDIREWGIHRSRRNKALKIWMSLRLNGLQGLRYHLNNSVEMCAYFESLVATHPLLKIFSRKLALFTFYYEEPGSSKEENNTYTENLCQFINQSHRLYLTHTKVHDTDLIRVSVCYERTNKAVIDESWAILKTLIDEFTNRKNDPYLLHTKMVAPMPQQKANFRPQSVEYIEISPFPPELRNSKSKQEVMSSSTHSKV